MFKRQFRGLILFFLLGYLLTACLSGVQTVDDSPLSEIEHVPAGMSEIEALTLASLDEIDGFPLYTMVYRGDYSVDDRQNSGSFENKHPQSWACSLFAIYGDSEDMLFGRNFDWNFSPAVLLYTDPPDGYASVSMVDIAYLGFDEERAFNITDLPLEERYDLLFTPYLPFDGMNEAGLVVGMAAVPDGGMVFDEDKPTIDSVMVIRMILDGAATVEEAVEIIKSYNIDMGGGPPLHYLIAEKSGRSALVEFSRGEIQVMENTQDWQLATNFLLSETEGYPGAQCWRYDVISTTLTSAKGVISPGEAMDLLSAAAQDSTQWSVVYRLTEGEIWVVMGRDYDRVYKFDFEVIY
jgi:hypothetical protein